MLAEFVLTDLASNGTPLETRNISFSESSEILHAYKSKNNYYWGYSRIAFSNHPPIFTKESF